MELQNLYEKFGYPSISKFLIILKQNNIKTSYKDVKDFILSQNVYQLHKPILHYKNKEKFAIAFKPYEMVQIDLLDYSKFSRQKDINLF